MNPTVTNYYCRVHNENKRSDNMTRKRKNGFRVKEKKRAIEPVWCGPQVSSTQKLITTGQEKGGKIFRTDSAAADSRTKKKP